MSETVLPQGAGYGVGKSHVHSMLDGVLTLSLSLVVGMLVSFAGVRLP